MSRRLIPRRKSDRVILALAVVGALALIGYMVACDDNGPTTPDPVVQQPTTPTPQTVTPVQVTPNPTATPKPELPLWVSCNAATGICTFGTDKPRPVSAKCTKPAQNDPFYGTWNATVNDGDTVDVRDVCNKIEPNDCSPKTVAVQVDFHGMGRHLGHLGPLYHLTFPQKLSPEECEECIEWKEPKISTECGAYGECHPLLQAATIEIAPECIKERSCVETHTWNCKEPDIKEYVDTQPCECCIETGPVVTAGQPLWMDARNPLEGQCDPEEVLPLEPGVQTSVGAPELNCHINGTQRITEDYVCEPDNTYTRFLCKNVECPAPALCYYNISGDAEKTSQEKCEEQLGVDAAWNAGSQQCVTSLPGVYHSDWQLTPGQSHPDCLKHTGPALY
jgi:hypothetical protein